MTKKIRDEHGNVYVQKKPFYKKIWFIVLVALFVIGALGNALKGGESSSQTTASTVSSSTATSSTDATTEQATTKTNVTEKKATVYGIGQEVPVGDVVYIVHSKEVTTNVGGEFGKNANGVYLVLNVTVKNNGKKAITVTDDFFTLQKGETTYKTDSAAGLYANQDANFFLSEVNPESTITGNVVFDITEETANDPSIQLKVQTGFWGTETGLINLQ